MYESSGYAASDYKDNPARVACPEFLDIEEPTPQRHDLLDILNDDIVFWEAFGPDGIEDIYKFPRNPHQISANRQQSLNFQRDVTDAIAMQDFDALGRLVSSLLLSYSERLWENKNL